MASTKLALKTATKSAGKSAAKHAKKAAKKQAKKSAGDQKPGDSLRRAYEHLGRVEALRRLAGKAFPSAAEKLVLMAKEYLDGHSATEAADLLRGAEHASFAELAGTGKSETEPGEDLMEAVARDFDKLTARAAERWPEESRGAALSEIFDEMTAGAREAYAGQRYRQALEFARGAEALTHVADRESSPRRLRA